MQLACLLGSALSALLAGGASSIVLAAPAPEASPAMDRPRLLLDQGWYGRADSLGSALLDSLAARAGTDSLSVAQLIDVVVEAVFRDQRAATDPRVLGLARRSLDLRRSCLGAEAPDLARNYCLMADVWMARSDYPRAIDAAERAVRLAETATPPEGLPLAAALYTLGLVRFNAGDAATADSVLREAHAIRSRLLPPDDPAIAESAGLLGIVAWDRGRMAEADSLLRFAVLVNRRSRGEDHPQTALALAHLGVERMIAGRSAEADSLHRLALPILERRFPPDHLAIGSELFRAGNSLAWGNHLEEALPYQERALAIFEKRLGPEAEYVADVCSSLGDLLSSLGDPARARPILERALAIREHLLGPDHPDVALSLDRLGEFLSATGENERARPLLERALAIRRKVLPAGHRDIAWSLERLGRCYALGDGNYRRAKPLYEEAIPIFLAEDPENPSSARGYGLRADLLLSEGRYREALDCDRRALPIYQKGYGEESEAVTWTRYSQACARWGMGDWGRAKEQFLLAAKGLRRSHMTRDLAVTGAEVSLGIVLAAEGRNTEAFETVMRALEPENRFLRANARLLTEEQALRFAAGRAGALHMALTLAAGPLRGSGAVARRTLEALVRERALVLDEMAARHHMYSARDARVDSLVERFAEASRLYANLEIRMAASPGASEGLRQRFAAAERDRNEAERDLARQSVAFRREQDVDRCGLAGLARILAPGTALISYVRYDRARPSRRGPAAPRRGSVDFWGWWYGPSTAPTPEYLAFVLRGGESTPRVVPLGRAGRIDAQVAAWRRQAARPVPASPSLARRCEREYRSAAVRLRQSVWDPIARGLAGARRVLIVPDGALDLVNFATLPVGKTSYLAERGPLIHYLSAERDVMAASSGPDSCRGLLAFGAPDFDARPADGAAGAEQEPDPSTRVYRGQRASCEAFRAARFRALPGSGAEAEEIASLWRGGGARCLVGAVATETAFKKLAPGREIVHVATHAFFVGEGCPSTLEAARGIGGTAPAEEAPGEASAGGGSGPAAHVGPFDRERPESPLLLYGLAFAGANRRDEAPPDRDDGILTAEEIAAMDLSGVRWAVLSACETGVGEVRAGEGVLGLRRAFQVAGVRTTIMSLWWVDDEATRRWMQALYRARLDRGRSTAESVRQAAREVLRERRASGGSTHPFTWGAFVASGDWR